MKKLVFLVAAAALSSSVFAQEAAAPAASAQPAESRRAMNDNWPAFFAVSEYPANPDVVGLRLTIPFSTRQESVTGLDVGFWGRSLSFEGIQVNVLRNDVKDRGAGFQVGLYNSIGTGEMIGVQAGLWNEAGSLRGVQAGLVNVSGETQGFQVGLVNRAETMYGYQVGLINVIRDAELQFFPIVNIGF